MFELSIGMLLLAWVTVLCASALQAVIGFGFALIVVPVLLLVDPALVPAPVIILALVQTLYSAWLHRRDIQWPMIGIALIGRIPGTVVATVLVAATGQAGISLIIAIAILAAVGMSLLRFEALPNKKNHLFAGFFAGISGTAAGIGGPPIALLYQREEGNVVRANLATFFFLGSIMSLIGMGLVGYVTVNSWFYAGMLWPASFLGSWIGLKYKDHLKSEFIRPVILVLCSASAVAVIVNTISNT